jgi:hypothetical protein
VGTNGNMCGRVRKREHWVFFIEKGMAVAEPNESQRNGLSVRGHVEEASGSFYETDVAWISLERYE